MTAHKILRWTGPAVLVAAVWFVAAFLPTGGATTDAIEQADQTRTQLIGVEQANEKLVEFADVEREAAGRIVRIRRAIPPTTGIADLIEMLALLGADRELELGEISPSPAPQVAVSSSETVEDDGPLLDPEELEALAAELAFADASGAADEEALSRISIGVRGTGPYAAVLDFVDDLSSGPRLITVTSIDIRPDDAQSEQVQFNLELVAFTTASAEVTDEGGPPAGPVGSQLDLSFEES